MPLKDLREKYAASKSRQAINAAIRAECAGGTQILDALEKVDCARADAIGRGVTAPETLLRCLAHVRAARDACEDAIRERYGMPPRQAEA